MSGWVKLENTAPENLKLLGLSDKAFRLWVHAMCFCSRGRTDGKVPGAAVTMLSTTANRATAQELVKAGLFDHADGGFEVHDYLKFNPSRAEIDSQRTAGRRRLADWRDRNRLQTESDPAGSNTDSRDRSVSDSVREIFSYWQEKCCHPHSKLSPDRRAKIEARLREGRTVEEIKRAIDGAACAPFVNDQGQRFDDIELVCRTGSKLESFIGRTPSPQTAKQHPDGEKITQEWIDRQEQRKEATQ